MKVFNLAVKHLGHGNMESSARATLAYAREHETMAYRYALRSLAYSVGICHPDYIEAHQELYGPDAPVTLHGVPFDRVGKQSGLPAGD